MPISSATNDIIIWTKCELLNLIHLCNISPSSNQIFSDLKFFPPFLSDSGISFFDLKMSKRTVSKIQMPPPPPPLPPTTAIMTTLLLPPYINSTFILIVSSWGFSWYFLWPSSVVYWILSLKVDCMFFFFPIPPIGQLQLQK